MMRTTLDLPDDLHRVVSSLALHTRRSLSATAVELMQRGLAAPAGRTDKAAARGNIKRNPVTGLPLIDPKRVLTPDDVKALEDDF